MRSARTPVMPEEPLSVEVSSEFRNRLQPHLLGMVDRAAAVVRLTDTERMELRQKLALLASQTLRHDWQDRLTSGQRERFVEELMNDVLGFGPLQPLLDDPEISEILINGPSETFVERCGRLERSPLRFRDREHLLEVMDRLLAGTGRRATAAQPYVDARLGDGIRVNVAVAPIAVDGPYVTIRKPLRSLLSMQRLIQLDTLTDEAAQLLQWCVQGRLNILISGPASSGKTTLLNVLAGAIPPHARIVLIEDTAELQLLHHHVVRLEAHPPNLAGQGEITIRQLVKNALHMRPDRILVGEVRGEEALDMLQAMTTGSEGSMATLHANAPSDVMDRVVTMALFSRTDVSVEAVRRQARSAIQLIVQMERFSDGSRRVTHICELRQDPDVPPTELFVLAKTVDGRERLQPTGAVPTLLGRLARRGVHVPSRFFTP